MSRTTVVFLAMLIVLGVMVSPVCAIGLEIVRPPHQWSGQNGTVERVYNLTVDELSRGNAIQQINVDLGTGTLVDFTFWYGNGQTVGGTMEYRNSTDCVDWIPFDAFCQYSGVSIGGDSHGYSHRGLAEIGRIDIVAYARNWTTDTTYTTGFLVTDTQFGFSEGIARAYFMVPNGTNNIIYKFSVIATKPVTVVWLTNPYDSVQTGVQKNIVETALDWKTTAEIYSSAIFEFLAFLVTFTVLFFVGGNFLLVIVLWFGVTLAYSAISSGDSFGFYRKFFRLQETFLKFVVFLWTTVVYIITAMIQALLKWL